ncbi:MAG: hypothetical protein FD147_2664, partial [Chloroflexi bacterium]
EACRRNVSFTEIVIIAKFFGEHLKDYGLEYIQLDDGYEKLPIPSDSKGTLSEGWLEINERFPEGHPGVIAKVRENGLQPAIWTNANVTNKEFAEKNSQNFIKDHDGKLMLGEWIDYLLNCSDETLIKHVYPYYKSLKDLGYTYFKTDAIRHLIMDGLHEAVRQGLISNDEARDRFRRFMEYARKGIGDQSYFLASWGVLSEAIGVVDACRIAMDANPTWAGIRMQLVESARWFHSQRILFLNDPDHICARTNIEWLKSVTSLIALSGSLFMLSDPLVEYTEERLTIIKKNLPPLTTMTGETGPMDITYPAFTWTMDMAGIYPTMDDDHPLSTLWCFHIDTPDRRWAVLGRFATVPLRSSEIKMTALGLDPESEYLAFDFWAQKSLGKVSRNMRCQPLELGRCQVLALVPVKNEPQFLASSRHVSMDVISVEKIQWLENKLTLEITGVPDTTEIYWFHTPDDFKLKSVKSSQSNTEWSQEGEIIKVDIDFKAKVVDLVLEFILDPSLMRI